MFKLLVLLLYMYIFFFFSTIIDSAVLYTTSTTKQPNQTVSDSKTISKKINTLNTPNSNVFFIPDSLNFSLPSNTNALVFITVISLLVLTIFNTELFADHKITYLLKKLISENINHVQDLYNQK